MFGLQLLINWQNELKELPTTTRFYAGMKLAAFEELSKHVQLIGLIIKKTLEYMQ